MPELPDLEDYRAALRDRMVGAEILRVDVVSPSLLRTYDPLIGALVGGRITAIERLGKRLVWQLEPAVSAAEP